VPADDAGDIICSIVEESIDTDLLIPDPVIYVDRNSVKPSIK